MSRFIWLVLTALLLHVGTSCSITGMPAEPGLAIVVAPDAPKWEVDREAYDELMPGSGSIRISRSAQRLTLLNELGQPVLETDCSTGKPGKETPSGTFRVEEKLEDKRSNKYGSYVSVITDQVLAPRSWRVKRPPGSRYVGTPMPYWLRLTWAGVGIHMGDFARGTRTSMGCIRVPLEAQQLLFEKAAVGMRVQID